MREVRRIDPLRGSCVQRSGRAWALLGGVLLLSGCGGGDGGGSAPPPSPPTPQPGSIQFEKPKDIPGSAKLFGNSVALTADGNKPAVGAAGDDLFEAGVVETGAIDSGAVHGDTLAVGVPVEDSKTTGVGDEQDDSTAPNAGAVYLY